MLLHSKTAQRLAGGKLEFLLAGITSRLQLVFLQAHKDPELVRLIKRIRRARPGPLANEIFMLYSLVRGQCKRPGDFAEVGVFQGGSARVICEAKGDRRLRLFDTFCGLPEDGSIRDGSALRKKTWACGRDKVEDYLKDFPNVSYHEGVFPESALGNSEIENAQYAFVHFDVDLYEGTRSCLEFFYPRMVPGGILMTHDYSVLPGVRKAFDEFFADRPEGPIELPTTQCMAIKI